jgi:hypothetical protein
MPFKSQAQRRKFAEMMVKGEISPETFEEWNRETGSRKLPERVAKKRTKARSKKRTSARVTRSKTRTKRRPARKKAGRR